MAFYVGCPVWACKEWVGNLYPEGTKPSDYLRQYGRRLTTIEGNTTFYAVPGPKAIEHWVSETPGSFRFCPKIPKSISHDGSLAPRMAAAGEFIEALRSLGERLGPIFLQLPPSYSPRLLDDLRLFLDAWPQEHRLAVEVRHPDWFAEPHEADLNAVLASHGMARVVIDTRPIRALEGDRLLTGTVYESLLEARKQKPDVPVPLASTADFSFLRFIGHPDMTINRPFLDEWAERLAPPLRQGLDVFVFCHSPETVAAPFVCRELHAAIRRRIPVPDLPWDAADTGTFDQPPLL